MDFKPTTDPLKSFLFVAGGWICVGLAVIGSVWGHPQGPGAAVKAFEAAIAAAMDSSPTG